MATVVSTQLARAENSLSRALEQWYGTSASATTITMASGGGVAAGSQGIRKLIGVTVKYSGAASTTVTVTHNFAGIGGTSYDVLLASTLLSAATDYVYQPSGDWYLAEGDTITVVAPAVTAVTAACVIILEQT